MINNSELNQRLTQLHRQNWVIQERITDRLTFTTDIYILESFRDDVPVYKNKDIDPFHVFIERELIVLDEHNRVVYQATTTPDLIQWLLNTPLPNKEEIL